MRIRRYRDEDASCPNEPCILGGNIEAVGAAVELEKAAFLPRVFDDSLEIELVAWTLEQQRPVAWPRMVK